ncbi:MAG: calcium/proton exchanger [Planctomycetales bacterium]|nr:calcium/proton exchanger [Planctomycetales bacterium]
MRWLERAGYVNLALIFLPIAIALEIRHAPALWVFATSALAIIPLAGLMGKSTEMLADRLGPGLGGLLNATFGNAAELIIALFALRAGMVDVVKASLVGSIVGNILLVLGASFLAGGMKFPKQSFNITAAGLSATLLALAAIGLVVPAFFHLHLQFHHAIVDEQTVSLEIAYVLFFSYCLMLIFSLKTHKHLYSGQSAMDSKDESTYADVEGHWPLWASITVLVVCTLLVALMSEFLVGAVESTRHTLGLTEVFVGLIVLAIVGNAAEHSTAVIVALKNRMELSYQIAVGSAIQIALFVAPVLVFASYGMDRQLDLNFSILEVVAVVVSVTVVALVAYDGESNWLEGVLLLAVYLILAIAFFNLPEIKVPSTEY